MKVASPEMMSIFCAAVERSPEERAAFVEQACGQNAELRGRIDDLLRAHDQAGGFLPENAEGASEQNNTEGPGTVIGNYKLLQQIGEGGMGLVFVAEQQQPVRRRVALKIIKPGMDSAVVSARFEAERQALAMMDHQNIAKVYDGGATESGRSYFVMELVHGVPITEFCDANKMTPRERLELFLPVCHAIQHAHQKGIIHRDIKPSNVLVTMYDDKPVPKVIDFGVAKAIEQRLADKTIYTQFGTLVGTLEYMSPEQVEMNAFGVDTRSDIYSLGVLLYELLTGTTPLERRRLCEAAFDEIRRLIREEEPQRPSVRLSTSGELIKVAAARHTEPAKLAPLVRGELDWVVMKCLEKDRTRRYETANGLARDVERYLKDEPVQAYPPSATYRFRKFAARHKGPVVAAALVVCALVVGVIGTSIGMVQALDAEELASERLKDVQKANASTTLALKEAKEARTQAEQSLKDAERSLYFQHIARAHLEWLNYDVGRADQLLEQCTKEHRNWEWHYLKNLCQSELFTFRGYKDSVFDVAFSPDGKRLATAGKDRNVKIWDIESGRELLTLPHQENVRRVCYSPDGRLLATCGGEWGSGGKGEVKVWDLAAKQSQFEFSGHGELATGIAFHPNGKVLATTGYDNLVRLWDLETNKEIRSIKGHRGAVRHATFSPDGERLVTGGNDRNVKVWNVADGTEIANLPTGSSVECVTFSPDGKSVLAGAYSGTAKLWKYLEPNRCDDLRGHAGVVYRVAFSLDGKNIVTAGTDGAVKIWNVSRKEELQTIRGHTGAVYSVAISPGGGCVATAGWDGTVKVFELHKSQTDRSVVMSIPGEKRGGSYVRVAFSADGQRLATPTRDLTATYNRPNSLQIWDSVTSELLLTVTRNRGFMSAAFSLDGKHLATDWGCDVKILDASNGKERATLKGHAEQVTAVAYDSFTSQLVSASADGTIKIWNLDTREEVRTLSGHAKPVTAIAIHPKGKILVSSSDDGSWRLWDMSSGQSTLTGTASGDALNWATFSPLGQHFASAGNDGFVRVWDVKSGKPVHSLPAHVGPASAVAYSIDGLRLASSGSDGKVRIWDATTGQEALTLNPRSRQLHSVAFSPNGRFLAAGSVYSEVRLWDKSEDSAGRQARSVATWRAVEADGYCARGEWAAAIAHLDPLIAAEPTQAEWFYKRGEAKRRLGQRDKAFEDYWRTLKLNPKHAKAISALFNATRAPESRDFSIAFFTKAIQDDSNNAMAHWYLGGGLWYAGKPKESLAYFQLGAALDHEDFRHPHSVGNNLRALNRLDEALVAYQKAINLDPRHAHVHSDLAFALRDKGLVKDAIAAWRTCLEHDVDHVHAHTSLAWLLATTDDPNLLDPKSARIHAAKAISLNGKDADHWANLGVANYRLGNAKAALNNLKKADQMWKGDYHHRFFLAMAYWQTGDKNMARKTFDEAVKWMEMHQPNNEEQRRFRIEAEKLLKQ